MADYSDQPSQLSTQLPSDLRHKIARAYVDDREFKDETGRTVRYSRFVVELVVAGQRVLFEARIGKNDKALIALADDFSKPPF